MDALSIAAASGMRARLESLDMLANNLANAATAGFKGDREFYNLYISAEARMWPAPSVLPVIEKQWTDFTQGALAPTGNPLDLAIRGRGFFVVETAGGPLYTRNGHFRLAADGRLVTEEGYPLRLAGGGNLQAAPGGALEVTPEGEVKQEGAVLGRIEIVDFTNLAALVKRPGGYFAAPAGTPQPASGYEIRQGHLESSNVNPAEAAVRLVSVMRQFEMLQRAISLGSEMNRRAVEEVAKVGS